MRAAVIFSGCGHLDGTEINEAVLLLTSLEKRKIEWVPFSPPASRKEVEKITRIQVHSLEELQAKEFDLIALPGGFGAALHLSNFASKKYHGEAIPILGKILKEFYEQQKPILALCIAPAIVALALKEVAHNLTITLGLNRTGAESCPFAHFKSAAANECVVDTKNRVVTTPAYMIEQANRFQIASGIEKAVDETAKICK